MSRRNKCVVWAGLLAVVLAAAPSMSQACGFCRRAAAMTYAPAPAVQAVNYAPMAVAAPACSTCAPVTSYMPITAYRAVYRPVTVTAFSPVRSCCLFGGGTTTYRPITSVMYSAQMVPYATYSPVVAQAVAYAPAPVATCSAYTAVPAVPAATCDTCATGATTTYRIGDTYSTLSTTVAASYPATVTAPAASSCYTPTVTQMPAAAPAAAPAPVVSQAPSYTPAPQVVSPGTTVTPPSTYGQPTYTQPTYTQPTYTQPGTVQRPITPAPATSAPATTPAPTPAPAPPAQSSPGTGTAAPGTGTSTSTNPMQVPQLIQPVSQPLVHQAVYYQPTSSPAPNSADSGRKLDVSGWHAAH